MSNQQCPVCKKISADENFCEHCRYPLNVKKLTDYGPGDIKHFLSDLQTVLRPYSGVRCGDPVLEQIYHELFNLNWLRPETAVTSFAVMRAMHQARKYFEYPTLDLGSGSGLFMAIFFGAQLHADKDDYGSVDLDKTDVYNSYQGAYAHMLAATPAPIGYGIDIKENAVKNATDLGVYDEVKVGDIRQLPFADGSMNTVFSNMIDDIPAHDLPAVFKEIHRVLPEGRYVIFSTPAEHFRDGLYYYPQAQAKVAQGQQAQAKTLMSYDRGRSEWEPRSKAFWEDWLRQQSFEMISYTPCMDGNMIKFWDVGWRPFFPQLLAVRQAMLEKKYFPEFKAAAVELLKNYFFSLVSKPLGPDTTFAVGVARKV